MPGAAAAALESRTTRFSFSPKSTVSASSRRVVSSTNSETTGKFSKERPGCLRSTRTHGIRPTYSALAETDGSGAGRRPVARQGWLYEPKYDGFRCLAFRDGDRINLQSKKQRWLN